MGNAEKRGEIVPSGLRPFKGIPSRIATFHAVKTQGASRANGAVASRGAGGHNEGFGAPGRSGGVEADGFGHVVESSRAGFEVSLGAVGTARGEPPNFLWDARMTTACPRP